MTTVYIKAFYVNLAVVIGMQHPGLGCQLAELAGKAANSLLTLQCII